VVLDIGVLAVSAEIKHVKTHRVFERINPSVRPTLSIFCGHQVTIDLRGISIADHKISRN